MSREVLLSVAPNGARKSRRDHPRLPLTATDLAAEAKACASAGAGLIHLHVRDADGGHSLDPHRYRESIAAIREAVDDDMIVQITTEAVGRYGIDEQIGVVEAIKPEACSVALRELCPTNAPADVARYAGFLRDCRAETIWVQHILYNPDDIVRFNLMRADGVYGDRAFVLLVTGGHGPDGDGSASKLMACLSALAATSLPMPDWAVCGFGIAESRIVTAAACLGGHVRIGFENNLLHADGSSAASNADRIDRVAGTLRTLDIRPMTAPCARTTLAARGA